MIPYLDETQTVDDTAATAVVENDASQAHGAAVTVDATTPVDYTDATYGEQADQSSRRSRARQYRWIRLGAASTKNG